MKLRPCALVPVWLTVGAPLFAAPTFTKDVAPILYRSCTGCHRPGDIAPMSLLTYKEARPWAAAIGEAVTTRQMPPWHADPHYGRFANDPRLSDAEIATLRAWVQAGAPEGSSKYLPAPPHSVEGWKIGKPDAVIDIGTNHTVKAHAKDEYTNFVVPTGFTEDKWVQAVELRPGNRKAVHHAHVSIQLPPGAAANAKQPKDAALAFMYTGEDHLGHMRPDAPVKNDGCAVVDAGNNYGRRTGQEGILASFVPGREPDRYPAGTAKLIPAGAKLNFQIHYAPDAKQDEVDRTSVGFIFLNHPPERPLKRMDLSNLLFSIPAGAANHEVRECNTFDRDVEMLSLTAHMHYRGKSMRFELERPGAERQVLLDIPRYSFEWQQVYRFEKPVLAPKGSRLMVTAHFDNSANNPANPDPSKAVRWGWQTVDEMMDGWLEYVDAKPAR